MSHRPDIKIFEKIRVEIDDAKSKIDLAIERCREGRALALEREDIQMIRLLKEIQLLLESVL